MSLLAIENVSKNYFGHTVLDQISLRLDKGERMALIGSNGSGKTTMLRLITGLEKPDSGRIIIPAGVVPGYLSQHVEEVCQLEETALHDQELSRLEQQLRDQELLIADFAEQTAATIHEDPSAKARQNLLLAEYSQLTARFEAAGGYDFQHRMQEALDGLGLTGELLYRPLSTLSGGERMKVALARLLLRSPDLLLLDEPTNHMDTRAMEWLEDYLLNFKGAVLLISHDRMFIDKTATSVAQLSQGRLSVTPGNYSKFIEIEASRQETLAREISNLSKELKRQEEVTQTMLSHRNISGYHAREKVVSKLSAQLSQIKQKARTENTRLKFSFMPSILDGAPDKELIEVKDVSLSFDGGRGQLFSEVSFTVNRTDKLCLCGPNGCGKSTLLKLLMGRINDFSGSIKLSRQARFGHLGQHVDFADENQTILGHVTSLTETDEAAARNLLAGYGFRDVDVFKKLNVLSGGERARVYLCCLLMEQPDMLFLDEPTNHLDINSREILEKALLNYNGAILSVSHDRYFIEKCADSVLGFCDDKVLAFDSYDDYSAFLKIQKQPLPGLKEQAAEAVQITDSSPDKQEKLNRAQERKAEAKRKQRLSDLEKEIHEMEAQKDEFESSFHENTSPEIYAQYALLLEKIEQHYEEYLVLSSDNS